MLVSISIKLVIMALISVFLLFKNGDKQIAIFEQQDWAVNKILPVYWALAVLSLVSLVTYRLMPNKFQQQLLSFPLTVVVGAILFTTLRRVVSKKNVGKGDVRSIFLFTSFLYSDK